MADIHLSPFPAIGAFMKRIRARPHVARAFDEERQLDVAELARHAAA